MRTILRRALVAALMIAGTGCASVYDRGLRPAVVDGYGPNNGYDVWTFHDSLDPYGRWFEYPGYGWVWSPYRTSAAWRPYSDGRWVDSDYGWMWMADEPWGWAPYHYGRWLDDPAYGWVWVPGTEWAPAWVAWRYDDNWIGWAPLPPDAEWSDGGLSPIAFDQIPAPRWSFVSRRDFLQDRLQRLTLPVSRNAPLIAETRDATVFEVRSGRPYNRGIDPAVVERLTGRRVKHLTVADAVSPGRQQIIGDQVELYRPTLQEPDAAPALRRQMEERRAAIERERRLKEQAEEEKRLAAQRERDAEARRIRDAEVERLRAAEQHDRDVRLERERALQSQRDRAAQAQRDRNARLESDRRNTMEREIAEARERDRRSNASSGASYDRNRRAAPARLPASTSRTTNGSRPTTTRPTVTNATRSTSGTTARKAVGSTPNSTTGKSVRTTTTTAAQRREIARRRAREAEIALAREKEKAERARQDHR